MIRDNIYMLRCLELAYSGIGCVSPNPMVGCVIEHDEKIIGEGYHRNYGGAHAEVNAINSVQNKELLKHSTLYVNLEPCVHYGKTPPCTDLIIKYQIPKVIISVLDCFSKVAGKGVVKLREAGINVKIGALSLKSRELNKRFFTFYEKKRPYIILKWAETIDGFIDIDRENTNIIGPAWITDEYSDILTHKWRAEEDSIMVGTKTAINDNPQLNVRHYFGKNPLRLVLDKNRKLPENLHLFSKLQNTIVFTDNYYDNVNKNLDYFKIDFKYDIIEQILDELYKIKIQSIIVEGGKKLLESFIDKNLWDEARIFICNKTFKQGLKSPIVNGKIISIQYVKSDNLKIIYNQ